MTSSRIVRGVLVGLVAIVLLGVLAFLYSRTEAIDFKRDAQTLDLLRELKELDMRWDADATQLATATTPGMALPERGPVLARILRELERGPARREVADALPAIKEGMAGKTAAWAALKASHARWHHIMVKPR